MANSLANNAIDFSEADDYDPRRRIGYAPTLNAQAGLKSQLEKKAAKKRFQLGQMTPADYLLFASQMPNRLVNNLVDSAVAGFTAPHDVLTGDLQVQDPLTGHSSEEAMRRSMDLAGLASTATIGASAEEGATTLGAGAMRRPTRTKEAVNQEYLDTIKAQSSAYNRVRDQVSEDTGQKFPGKLVDDALANDLEYQRYDKKLQGLRDELMPLLSASERSAVHASDRALSEATTDVDALEAKHGPSDNAELYSGKSKEAGVLALASDHPQWGQAAFKFRGKLYTDDFHAGAIDKFLAANGYKKAAEGGLEDAIHDMPDLQNVADESLGGIGKDGKFVPFTSDEISKTPRRSGGFFANKSKEAGGLFLAAGKEPAPVFYSAVEKAIDASSTKSASGDQWLGTLRNAPGVKGEEIEWTGLEKALKDRPGANQPKQWTKEEVKQALQANKVNVEEHWKESPPEDPFDQELSGEYAPNETKFSEYQLPGGENYRELVMTLPEESAHIAALRDELENLVAMPSKITTYKGEDRTAAYDRLHREFVTAGGTPRRGEGAYRSSHWDETNVLAHVRMNDRELPGADGTPQRTLFLEELQSDWHQSGRKSGYKGTGQTPEQLLQAGLDEGRITIEPTVDGTWLVRIKNHAGNQPAVRVFVDRTKADEWMLANAKAEANMLDSDRVPDAPFKRSWPSLLLNRMVREAAEKGYDQIAWTDGATQAERYDLSKHISQLTYSDKGTLRAYDKSGSKIIEQVVPESKLPDYIGKEGAEKLSKAPVQEDGFRRLQGLDLKVGGEGMRGFYDDMLPKIANKNYGKLGGKVRTEKYELNIDNTTREERLNKVDDDAAAGEALDWLVEQGKIKRKNTEGWQVSKDGDVWKITDRQGNYVGGRHTLNAETAEEAVRQVSLPERWSEAEPDKLIKKALESGWDGGTYYAKKGTTIHVLPITPQMREHALSKGFPLFSSGVPIVDDTGPQPYHRDEEIKGIKLVPVEGDPFND